MNICDESSSSWQQTMAAAYTHRCSGPAGPRGEDAPLHERELSSLSCHQNITRLPRKLLAADTWTPPRMQDGGKKTSVVASDGFNWPSGQQENSASAAEVDA